MILIKVFFEYINKIENSFLYLLLLFIFYYYIYYLFCILLQFILSFRIYLISTSAYLKHEVSASHVLVCGYQDDGSIATVMMFYNDNFYYDNKRP